MAEDQTRQDANLDDLYSALYRVARAINSSLDEDEVLQLVARNVTEAMDLKGCAIRLLSPDGERLDLIAARYLGDPEQSWRQCDANGAVRPEELEEVGRRVRITLPEGIPGGGGQDA